ncbi:MAG: RAMP superfamily CRISPR-associated protein [Defluviicoccus sp.]
MTVPFKNRWLIEGMVTLSSPLELRTGLAAERAVKGASGEEEDRTAEVALVQRDCDNQPCILGSSLKGVLRAWLAERLPNEKASIENVFGRKPQAWKKDPAKQAGLGGKAEFLDAFLADLSFVVGEFSAVPLPQLGRAAIERPTRTAAHERLFHGEQVPTATAFKVKVAGDSLTPHEVVLLLAALEGFNAKDDDLPITLGGGGARGTGRADWQLVSVRCMDVAAVARWLGEAKPRPWHEAIGDDPRTARDRAKLADQARALLAGATRPAWLALDLKLAFSGPFLVNDPTRLKEKEEGKNHPDFEPTRDHNGRPLLPGSSVKGALRAQAERIFRTVHGEQALPKPDDNGDGRPRNEIEWLFGVGGWRGMLTVSDFSEVSPPANAKDGFAEQEFVAIDRFTGGAAEGAKFKARVAEAPVMEGRLSLRLTRPRETVSHYHARWALGLMALVLRDLVEGDITFGYGAAKGFGACTVTIKGPFGSPAARLCEALPGLPLPTLAPAASRDAARKLYGQAIGAALTSFRAPWEDL